MALFKKKKEVLGLPELPQLPELPKFPQSMELSPLQKTALPELPQLPEIPDELSALPSFPSSETGERVSQDFVKEAVSEPFRPLPQQMFKFQGNIPSMPSSGLKERKVFEVEDEEEEAQAVTPAQVPSYPIAPYRRQEMAPKKSEPVFVRIDKFEEAIDSFNLVRKKLIDIEASLKELKSIKEKEEHELIEWEQEMESIKSKIDNIDTKVFSKLD